MCDAEFVPETVEYTTDDDGMKRVGFIEGEEPKMTPLPKDKEKEKEEEEKAIRAMEALNLKDETPPGQDEGEKEGEEKDAEEEDVNNGADFDVVVPSEAEAPLPTPSKSVMEAESNAEGDAQLVPVAKPKAKLDRPLATTVAPDALKTLSGFLRGPFLVADGCDSDSAAAAPAQPLPIAPSPLRSSLKRSGSRAPSKSRGRSQSHVDKGETRDRSRTRTSPERVKPLGAVSGCLMDLSSLPPRSQDLMPSDWDSVTLKADFLQWTLRSLARDWKHGARAWVNLHVSLYMFTPSKYWVAHPRCLAACSISGDHSLSERFCCWTCHLPSKKSEGEGHYKSLWPTLDDFIWHWYQCHACDAHFDWDSVAVHLGLTCEDLAFSLLSIDLGATPLPVKPEAISVLPDLLPPRPQGHNELIYAKPWYRLQEGGFRYVPKPPSYPPPHVSKHVGPIRPLPSSSSCAGSALPSSAVSALRGLPSLNATPETTSAKSGATSKSANRPKEPVVVKAPPKAAPLLALGALPKPAVVGGNGSRFVLDAAPQKGYTRMGWLDPVANFGKLISAEISHYAYPFENMMAYSRSRPLWHQIFCGSNQALKEWLLATEEHAFYLFSVKALASLVMMTPSVMKPADREVVLVMERIHSADLADELSHLKSFRYHNDTSVYVASVIAHVRSIIDLRVPLPEGFTIHRAPAWKQIPQKGLAPVLYKLPTK